MQITKPSDLARTVKTRRQALGLTQQDVAEAAGITRQSLARIEHGNGGTTFDTVLRVFEQLGLTLDAAAPAQRREPPAAPVDTISRAFQSATAEIAAINAAVLSEPAVLSGWQKGLAETLRRARDARTDSADVSTARQDRVAALDAAIRAGDPDRVGGNG